MANPKEIVESIENAIGTFGKKDMQMQDVIMSLSNLGISFHHMIDAIKHCDNEVTQREVKILTKMIENFKNPKDLAYKIGTNIVINGVDIYNEMSAAYTNYLAKEYESFGKDIGISLSLVFIGASNAARVHPGAAKVMESMADMMLYPQLTEQVYHDRDNSKYVDFLDQIANSDDPTSAIVPNYNVHLVNLVPVQPVIVDTQQYLNLLNLMSSQQQNGYLY